MYYDRYNTEQRTGSNLDVFSFTIGELARVALEAIKEKTLLQTDSDALRFALRAVGLGLHALTAEQVGQVLETTGLAVSGSGRSN